MAPPLLTLADMELSFGGDPLLAGASLIVNPRDRIALVGRNGSGKSTLLKIAAGLVEPDAGRRFVDPGATTGYLEQAPDLSGFETLGAYVEADLNETSDPAAARRLMDALGVDRRADPALVSGGEARRAAIARLLAAEPDILLLDEPTNHLDLPAIGWLEETLRASPAAVVVISHDRRFLEKVTTQTVWIDRGRTRSLDRGFAAFEAWRDQLLEEEERERHKLDRKIAAEEDWVRYGVTARRKRNVRRMRELDEMRARRRGERTAQGSVKFTTAAADASGKQVMVAEGVSKSYGERRIVDDFSIEIARGDRVGLIGPNGAGKTTLVKLLTGVIAPDDGAVSLGTNLDIVSLDQRRAGLRDDESVADAITDGRGDWVEIGGAKRHVSTYLKDFLFAPEQWRAPVGALSGGERGRLARAAAMAKRSNLLVLDEPTNDLDLETLELLEEMLADYSGTLLLVSHDRAFLDHIVTSIVTTDPEGRAGTWIEYPGGYDDMVRQRGSAPGFESPGANRYSVHESKKPRNADGSEGRPARPKNASARLSYKEKYALEKLPGEIARLEAEIAAANDALADQALYEKNPDEFAKLADALARAEARLSEAEDEWLALEMKREASCS